MEISFDKTGKTTKIRFNGKVKALLKKLKVNHETVLVTRGNDLLNEEDNVSNKDRIKLLSVVSGG